MAEAALRGAAVEPRLQDVAGEPREIRATGGFAHSALWRQIMADVFRREIDFPDSYEGSCWGAVLLGMKALGAIDSLDVSKQMTKISTRHRPDENSARVYEELMKIFIRLYERLEPEFAAISRLVRPSATSRSTSSSRAVSGVSAGVGTPGGVAGAGPGQQLVGGRAAHRGAGDLRRADQTSTATRSSTRLNTNPPMASDAIAATAR